MIVSLRMRRFAVGDACRVLTGSAGLLGADQDPAAFLATEHLVGRRRRDVAKVGGVDLQLAAGAATLRAAPPRRPRCGRRPACRTAPSGRRGCPGPDRRARCGRRQSWRPAPPASASRRVVTSSMVPCMDPSLRAQVGPRCSHRRLQLLHDLELGVLQVADPLLQVLDLLDHGVQGLGIGHRTVGDPALIPGEPLTYRLEIRLGPGLIGLQVTHRGLGGHLRRTQPVGVDPQALQLGVLGQGAPPMLQLSDRRVDFLQREQAEPAPPGLPE